MMKNKYAFYRQVTNIDFGMTAAKGNTSFQLLILKLKQKGFQRIDRAKIEN